MRTTQSSGLIWAMREELLTPSVARLAELSVCQRQPIALDRKPEPTPS
jgi:hypothetical protein